MKQHSEEKTSGGKPFPFRDKILSALFDQKGLAFIMFMRVREVPGILCVDRIMVQGTGGMVFAVTNCILEKGGVSPRFILMLVDHAGSSIEFSPSKFLDAYNEATERGLAVASSSASLRQEIGDDYLPKDFWTPMSKDRLGEALFKFGFFPKTEPRQGANILIGVAESLTTSSSSSKLLTFEKYFTRSSPLWFYVLNVLNCYGLLSSLRQNLSEVEYQNLFAAVPQAIEAKASMGQYAAIGFVNFMTELKGDYQKNGQVTGNFLALWAVGHLDHNRFPAELGMREVLILGKIGEELISVVCGNVALS